MSNPGFVDALSIPILAKAVDFLFDQGKRILEERRERRLSERTTQEDELSDSPSEELKTDILIAESIRSKEDASNYKIDNSLWLETEDEVNHLISLLGIYTKNYYLSKEKRAKWGSTLVPNIIIHELDEAEDQIARTIEQLERTLSRVYSESSEAYSAIADEENDSFEKGFLDFVVDGYQAFEIIGNSATDFAETTDILGELLNSHTERLNKLKGPGLASQAHKIAAATARDMTNYASEVDKYQAELSDGIPLLEESTSSLIKWIRLGPEEDPTNKESLMSYREAIVSLGASVSEANTSIDGMRNSAIGLASQRISRAMNRACTKVIKSLEKTINTMDALEDFVHSTIKLVDERLEGH